MKNRDTYMAVFWILLGTTIAVWSFTFPFGNLEDPGPGYFPAATGVIIGVIGILLFVQSRKAENANGAASVAHRASRGPAARRVALYLAAMIGCTLFLEILGFALAMFLMLLFMMRTIAPRRWRTAVFYSLVFSLGSLFVFKILLKTQLPSGFLRF